MNQKHKDFITKKLIPFILREQGRGFAMDSWIEEDLEPGGKFNFDDIDRNVPRCGTVACIGGSAQFLAKGKDANKVLGLTYEQADTLFYGWEADDESTIGWPEKYVARYAKAKTTLSKAKVAVALLKEVVKTEGKILEAK